MFDLFAAKPSFDDCYAFRESAGHLPISFDVVHALTSRAHVSWSPSTVGLSSNSRGIGTSPAAARPGGQRDAMALFRRAIPELPRGRRQPARAPSPLSVD